MCNMLDAHGKRHLQQQKRQPKNAARDEDYYDYSIRWNTAASATMITSAASLRGII